MFADFVDCANIGMVEGRRRTRLPAEALECLLVARQLIRQEFEGDEATECGVLGLVDHTHAAATKFLDDAVVRDGLADHWEMARPKVCFILRSDLPRVNERWLGWLGSERIETGTSRLGMAYSAE